MTSQTRSNQAETGQAQSGPVRHAHSVPRSVIARPDAHRPDAHRAAVELPLPPPPARCRNAHQVTVRLWNDPALRQTGHDARSAYVERFWVPILGPSASWLLRLIAREFDEVAPGTELTLDLISVARRLGLKHRGGRSSTLMRVIERCVQFGMAEFSHDGTLAVRRLVPSVPRKFHERLPLELREEISRWFRSDGGCEFSVGETRLLASCMILLGHGLHESAERLVMLGLAPNAANEATAWAWAERCARR